MSPATKSCRCQVCGFVAELPMTETCYKHPCPRCKGKMGEDNTPTIVAPVSFAEPEQIKATVVGSYADLSRTERRRMQKQDRISKKFDPRTPSPVSDLMLKTWPEVGKESVRTPYCKHCNVPIRFRKADRWQCFSCGRWFDAADVTRLLETDI